MFVLHAITFAAAISFIEVKVYVTLNRVLCNQQMCIAIDTFEYTLLLNDCGAGTEIKGFQHRHMFQLHVY